MMRGSGKRILVAVGLGLLTGCGATAESPVFPDAIGGSFQFVLSERPGQGPVTQGLGQLFQPALELPELYRLVHQGHPDLADGACRDLVPVTVVNDGLTLDAGESLTLAGPAGVLSLRKAPIGSVIYYASDLAPGTLFRPAAEYTLSAPGGPDQDAFEGSFASPQLVLADWLMAGPLTLGRLADYPVTWSSVGDGSVFVELTQGYGYDTVSWVCRLADDGEGVLPATVLGEFEAGEALLQVYRFRVTWFDVTGLEGPVLGIFGAEQAAEVTLE